MLLIKPSLNMTNQPFKEDTPSPTTPTSSHFPMPLSEIREKLLHLQEIESVSGARYINIHITKKMIIGIRESTGKEFTINLNQLYDAYLHCTRLTSPEVKKYIFMGHSPALAILRMLR